MQASEKPAAAAAPKVKEEPAKPIVYATKEAAKEAFKALLTDFDIPAGTFLHCLPTELILELFTCFRKFQNL
jgi:hypothetical protein